jgi:hypothetical protein
VSMREEGYRPNQLPQKGTLLSVWRTVPSIALAFILGTAGLHSQCPDTGQTKVIKPAQGNGFRFYRFLGDSSFVYFLDGKTFSFNDKDDPGKTITFIDDFAYESILVETADLKTYVKSSNPLDILSAQAKHAQLHFKTSVPSMVITDYGPSAMKNPDGSVNRLFYLWKKESAPGTPPATQYLVSTLIKNGVVVLSVMPGKGSVSDNDLFLQVQNYTSHFEVLSSDRCAKVLSLPSAP